MMSKGYSKQFTGTAGSIGSNQYYQFSLSDEMPVRVKASDVNTGIAKGISDARRVITKNKQTITVELILLMCKHCREEKITQRHLIEWLALISSSPNVTVEVTLQKVIDDYIIILSKSIADASFWKYLSRFENDLTLYCA